jgi:hypothetical protein
VARGYFDPHEWRSDIETLSAELGEERVIPWETRRDTAMAAALDRLHTGLMTGEIWHDADLLAAEHYGNAYVARRGRLRLVRKEYPNSPRKIDSVVGDALALRGSSGRLAAVGHLNLSRPTSGCRDDLGGAACGTHPLRVETIEVPEAVPRRPGAGRRAELALLPAQQRIEQLGMAIPPSMRRFLVVRTGRGWWSARSRAGRRSGR